MWKWKPRTIKAPLVANFPEADRPAAAALLSDLIDNYQGRECQRVLGVVLAMADGDLPSLTTAVRLALGDYRDVLALEEYTGSRRLRSEPAQAWLANYFANSAVPKGMR